MRKQMFIKSYLMKIAFLLVFLTGAVPTYSAVLFVDHQLDTPLLQELDISGQDKKKAVPLMVFAQNQPGSSNNEPLGEIVFLNTTEEGQSSIISIESTQPVQYTAFKLLNPLRLILDFPKMEKGNLTSRIQVDTGIVNSIRPIHFEEAGVLRLEIVLNQSADYEINKPEKNKLIIRLRSSGQVSGEEMAQMSPSMKEATPSSKRGIKKEFYKKSLRGAASLMEEAEEAEEVALNEDTCFPMLFGEKEKISLDFQNADVRNLFRIFAEISGFNVILSPEVGGSVNIRMIDVPWNQAMEIILTNSALGRECFGDNIVRVAAKVTLAAEDAARVVEKGRAASERINERNSQDLVTEVVRIDHADITELSASLTALKSARNDALITVDTRTNTLILNDLRHHMDDMLETIKILDIPTTQVLIEAKIVEISKSFSQEFGISWGFVPDLAPNTPQVSGNTNFDSQFMVDLTPTVDIKTGNVASIEALIGGVLPGLDLNVQLEASGKGRVISSTRVTTADNKEARIKSGSKIPYQVTSVEGNSVQFVDAELSLTVTPHVTSDNSIYLIIETTKNSADFSNTVNNAPAINTKEMHTEVLVGNGQTTVLGGIYESTSTENKKAVP